METLFKRSRDVRETNKFPTLTSWKIEFWQKQYVERRLLISMWVVEREKERHRWRHLLSRGWKTTQRRRKILTERVCAGGVWWRCRCERKYFPSVGCQEFREFIFSDRLSSTFFPLPSCNLYHGKFFSSAFSISLACFVVVVFFFALPCWKINEKFSLYSQSPLVFD